MEKYSQDELAEAVYTFLSQEDPDFSVAIRSDGSFEYSEILILFDNYIMSVSIVVKQKPKKSDVVIAVLNPETKKPAIAYQGKKIYIIDKENITCETLIDLYDYVTAVLRAAMQFSEDSWQVLEEGKRKDAIAANLVVNVDDADSEGNFAEMVDM